MTIKELEEISEKLNQKLLNDSWVQVNIDSLREALGLKRFDEMNLGFFLNEKEELVFGDLDTKEEIGWSNNEHEIVQID